MQYIEPNFFGKELDTILLRPTFNKRQKDRQTDRQTDRQKDRKTDKQTNRQTVRPNFTHNAIFKRKSMHWDMTQRRL